VSERWFTTPAGNHESAIRGRLRSPGYFRRGVSSPVRTVTEQERNRVIIGDALETLHRLPGLLVDCVITSPPYFLLRNYDVNGQIGAEASVDDYVASVVTVGDEIERVLKEGGAFWLNLGDSYSRHDRYGAPPKSLLLAPERILMALASRGWIVRNKVVWAKPNPMPASVGDRLTCSWEPLYLLVKSRHYFFDLDAIRVPHRTTRRPSRVSVAAKYSEQKRPAWAGPLAGTNDGLLKAQREGRAGHVRGKNPGEVWRLATGGFRGTHFATFPSALIEKPILATCPERVCAVCGLPWQRAVRSIRPSCTCKASWRAGLVLDPFIGAGTVAIVAERLDRDWLGIELNPQYARLAEERIARARLEHSEAAA